MKLETRIGKAKKIVEFNKDIFEEGKHTITEINAGFNNDIFNVDNTYIIKVCGNEKESEFEVEANFYTENKNSKNIPKLYKYDNSKKPIKQVYEIIEKVEGKTVYYHWYKWNEKQRAGFIKELMNIIKELHSNKQNGYDWANKIKSQVQSYYNKCMDLFNNNEQEIINKTLELYDEILSDNRFSLIHNDLHFDNILISESNEIKIIDFNDSKIAPIDYDLRILFMCKDRPWKWANAEMDPFQKPQDYANIQTYIKRYYEELDKIKHLDKRMTIYEIMNDIKLLSRFKNETELKENIIAKSKSLFFNC